MTGGPITGNSTLVVSGTGSVTLQSANTFTGVVAVDGGGTLNINADNELGNSSNNVSLTSSSSSQLSTLEVTTSFLTARGITLYSVGGGIDVTGANTFTVSGGLAGTGGLTKLDTGTLLLTSTSNSYAGPTNVSAGTLQMGAAGAIPAFTNLTVATNAVFDTQTFSNNVGSIAGAGTIKIGTGATLTTGFDNAQHDFLRLDYRRGKPGQDGQWKPHAFGRIQLVLRWLSDRRRRNRIRRHGRAGYRGSSRCPAARRSN